MAHIRTVYECAQVVHDVQAAQARYPRLGDAWDAWLWRIARGPDWNYAVPGYPDFYMFKSNPSFGHYGVPTTTILYRIVDADNVEITGVLIP